MRNLNFAHQFFYDSKQEYKRNKNVSYFDNKYFSYSTCISKITQDKQGDFILLLSDNNFSNTTAKHICEIRNANPRYPVLYLPQFYGKQDFDVDSIIEEILKNLDYYKDSRLTQKVNRENYIKYFEYLLNINEHLKDINPDILEKYKPLYNSLNNPDFVKKEKEKQRKKDVEKQRLLKEQLKEYLKLSLMEKARLAFNRDIDSTIRNKLQALINPKNDFSFAWIENDKIHTSKNIWMDIEKIKPFLIAWKKSILKHGQMIDNYTILSITENHVKIGCHLIPVENIKNLYDSIF